MDNFDSMGSNNGNVSEFHMNFNLNNLESIENQFSNFDNSQQSQSSSTISNNSSINNHINK